MAALVTVTLASGTGLATSSASPREGHAVAPTQQVVPAPPIVAASSVTGRVSVPWSADAISLVAVIPNDVRVAPAKPEPVLDQRELTFVPRLLPVTLGTVVRFRNRDALLHKVFALLVIETPFWVLTDDRGDYRIDGLPAGPAMLRFWTETGEPVEQWIEIEADAETRIDFTFPRRRRGGWLDSVW